MIIKKTSTASLWRRLVAMLYDTLIVLALLMLAGTLAVIVNGGHPIKPGNPFFALYLVAIIFTYFAFSWIYGGQTIGMRVWRLSINTTDHEPMDLWHALLRFGFAIPSLSFAGLGLFWMLVDKEKRALYDRWSKTMIVYNPKPSSSNASQQ